MNESRGGSSFFMLFVPLGLFLMTMASAQKACPASRLDEVLKRKELRICATGDYKPFTYLSSKGLFSGMDIDLARDFATDLGVKPKFIKTTWSTLLKDFKDSCDIAVGGISITPEREGEVFFTDSILSGGKAPIVRCGDEAKYQTIAQINQPGVRVIVNPGGTNEIFAKKNFSQANLRIFPDNVTIFREIADGRADVMVTDSFETLLQQKLYKDRLCAVNPDKPFTRVDKAYILPYGDFKFKSRADRWLRDKKNDGAFERIKKKWLD